MEMHEITAEEIRQIILNAMEDTELPEQVVGLLGEMRGKPLTKVQADKVGEKLGKSCRIDKRYGMTYFQVSSDGKNTELELLIDWKIKNVEIPSKETLIERNPALFHGAKARNQARQKALNGGLIPFIELANHINQHNRSTAKIKEFFAFGSCFHHDGYLLKEFICGTDI